MTSNDPIFLVLIALNAGSAIAAGIIAAEWAVNPGRFSLFKRKKK